MNDQYFHKIKLRFADGHTETFEGIFIVRFYFARVEIDIYNSENCVVSRRFYSFPSDVNAFVIS